MARERERESVRIRRTIRVLTVNAIAEGNDAIAPEAKGGGGREERERVYSTCRLLVRNGTSIFHADRCDVRFIVNTFRATTSNILFPRGVRVSRLPMLRVDFTGWEEGRGGGDFVYNNLGITTGCKSVRRKCCIRLYRC